MSLTLRASRHSVSLLLSVFLTSLALSCVTGELRSVDAARAKYDECVAEYSTDDPACRELNKSLQAAQREYESKSQRAWNCDPLSENCPTRY